MVQKYRGRSTAVLANLRAHVASLVNMMRDDGTGTVRDVLQFVADN
jgi:hypothetical protein